MNLHLRSVVARCAMAVLGIAAFQATAAEPGLEVHLQPRRFGVEDMTQLTVRITEPPSELQAPRLGELDNLEVIAGPSTGPSSRGRLRWGPSLRGSARSNCVPIPSVPMLSKAVSPGPRGEGGGRLFPAIRSPR